MSLVTLGKVKGHVAQSACEPGSQAWRDAAGNGFADKLAKRGAKSRTLDP